MTLLLATAATALAALAALAASTAAGAARTMAYAARGATGQVVAPALALAWLAAARLQQIIPPVAHLSRCSKIKSLS